jgi:hypothetical protein
MKDRYDGFAVKNRKILKSFEPETIEMQKNIATFVLGVHWMKAKSG